MLTLLWLLSVSAWAGDFETKIDHMITTAFERGVFNGAVMVVDGDRVLFEKALGVAGAGGEKLTLEHSFYLASVTKQFTAAGVMLLVQDGKLTYDQSLASIFPDLPYPGIKIRHLLHHTSGLPDYIQLFEAHWEPGEKDVFKKRVAFNKDVLAMLKRHQPKALFPPGEQFAYNNTGYVVLASVVEAVSGQTFGEFMAERVFKPLKMDQAYVYNGKKSPGKRVYGFLGEGSEQKPNDLTYLAGINGDGGIYASPGDLRKWDRALHERKLLSAESLTLAFKPLTLNNGETRPYGFGWDLIEKSHGLAMAHSGSWLGFRAYFRRVPHKQRAMVVLTNNTSSATRDLVYALLDIMEGKPYEAPKMSIVGPLAMVFMEKGAKAGVAAYHEMKKDGDRFNFSEGELNDLGYLMVKSKRADLALAVFQLNVEMFPNRANPHDSLGEAYLLNGMREKAVTSYERALALDPENHNARAVINKLKGDESGMDQP